MAKASEAETVRLYSTLVTAVEILVHSNLFVSVSATSVALTTILLADLPFDPVPLFIVFAATLFVYSFNRITDLAEDEQNVPTRANFTKKYGKKLFAVGVSLYIAALALAVYLGLPGVPFLALPLVVGAVYSLGGKRFLLVKNLLVGGAWGIIPLGVGIYYGVLARTEILFLSGFFVVAVTVAAALFDIKDIEGDREEGIHTVPNVYGPRTTRLVSAVVVLSLVPFVVAAGATFSSQFFVLLGFLAYVLAYVPFATRDRGVLFYGFVIDGEHIFVAVLTLATEIL
jgi:4-hydroxybenzoate polyprenyltransferase